LTLPAAGASIEAGMVKIYNKETGELLGRVAEADLEFLQANLEEEGLKDSDYYLRRETIDEFRSAGASAHLVEVLMGGLRNLPAIEVRWERDKEE
jgi:hypothetical protein